MDGSGVAAEVDALVVGMIGMFFLTLIIILFVVVYQRKLLKQERRHKAAEEAHQLELLQATIESQEVERDRIGRELHDGVGVMLSTTRMYLELWKEEDEAGKAQASNRVDALLGETIESVRRVSADLRPVVLENLGLAEAIGALIHTVKQASGLAIHFEAHYEHPLAQKDELNIYRVVQELLTNALRHSEATEVRLSMGAHMHRFYLSYRDNGKGFPKDREVYQGLGLKNIESRINALNGQISLENAPEGGVSINIEIDKNENDKSSPGR